MKVHQSPPHRPDSKDGHLQYELGESITPVYKILAPLGEGTFGTVFKARELVCEKAVVALKQITFNCDGDEEGIPSTALREIAFLREVLIIINCNPDIDSV